MASELTKTCLRCKVAKPFALLVKDKRAPEGCRRVCVSCVTERWRVLRHAKPDVIRKYRRDYNRTHRDVVVLSDRNYKSQPQNKLKIHAGYRARLIHTDDTAPAACGRCGTAGLRLERHHPDYSQLTLIEWLCKPCHSQADDERRLKEARKMADANYHDENDRLAEAGAILRGETRKLPTLEHLNALHQLIARAQELAYMHPGEDVDLYEYLGMREDWRREVAKIL